MAKQNNNKGKFKFIPVSIIYTASEDLAEQLEQKLEELDEKYSDYSYSGIVTVEINQISFTSRNAEIMLMFQKKGIKKN